MMRRLGLQNIILIVLAAFVLLRFLPLFMRLLQAVAIGARAYWWVVLPLMILIYVVYKFKRRSRFHPPMRDVTHSFKS